MFSRKLVKLKEIHASISTMLGLIIYEVFILFIFHGVKGFSNPKFGSVRFQSSLYQIVNLASKFILKCDIIKNFMRRWLNFSIIEIMLGKKIPIDKIS